MKGQEAGENFIMKRPVILLFTKYMIASSRVRRAVRGEMRNAYKILVGKPKEKGPPGRSRHRWEDNIKIDIREIRWESGLDSFGSGWGPVAGSCEYVSEPLGSIRGGNF
jgi:hypothetical protein